MSSDKSLEVLRVSALFKSNFHSDNSRSNELSELLVEGLHSGSLTGLHSGADEVNLIVTDHSLDRVGSVQYLADSDTAGTIEGTAEGLSAYTYENGSELSSDLVLLMSGEYVDDTVNGRRSGGSMKGTHNKVTGFSGGYSGFDSLEVTHFSYEYDIRVLTEGGTDSECEGGYVSADLTLVYHAALVSVQILDRVFDSDYMSRLMQIYVVDHSRKRCRLTGTGRTGYEHESTGTHNELSEYGRQVEVGKGRDIVSQQSDSDSRKASLTVYVYTVTEAAGGNVSKVGVDMVTYLLHLALVGHLTADTLDINFSRIRIGRELSEVTSLSYDGGDTYGKMQVGAAESTRLVKNFVNVNWHSYYLHLFDAMSVRRVPKPDRAL